MALRCLALVLAGAAGSGCGPSFASVRAVAAVGEQLGRYGGALDNAPRYCAAFEKALGNASPDCASLADDGAGWRKANAVLAGYASALELMATDRKPNVKDAVQAAVATGIARFQVKGLSLDAAPGLAELAQALVDLFSGSYRHEQLRATIARVAPRLAIVIARIDENLRAQGETLARLHQAIDGGYDLLDPGGQRLALFGFQIWVEDQARALLDYQRALDTFAAAHAALAAHIDKLDDASFFLDVVSTIRAAAVGADKALAPAKKKVP